MVAPSTGATVAAVAAALELMVVTDLARAEIIVGGVLDLGSTADVRTVGRVTETDGESRLAILRWEPDRPDGRLPDLTAALAAAIPSHISALVISPARPVNPPAEVAAHAAGVGITLLWDRNCVVSLDRLQRVVADLGPHKPWPSAGAIAAALLAVADDLPALCTVLGDALGMSVALRATTALPTAAERDRTVFPLDRHTEVVLGADLQRGAPQPLDEQAHAVITSALPLLRLHAKAANESPDERDAEAIRALKEILGDDLAQREQAIRRSRRLALFDPGSRMILAVEPFNVSLDMPRLHRLRSQIAPVARRADPGSVTISKEGLAVVLISPDIDLGTLLKELRRAANVPIAIGSGDPMTEPRGYPGSFRQARRAVSVGIRIGAINRLTRHSDIGVLALLYQLPEHARRSFVSEVLGPIAENTSASLEQRRILRTLRATDCNISESARRLFVHPNTLRTKISRIESITGPFMADPEHRLTVFTALTMFSLDRSDVDQ